MDFHRSDGTFAFFVTEQIKPLFSSFYGGRIEHAVGSLWTLIFPSINWCCHFRGLGLTLLDFSQGF
jgi:hypothetical protein